MADANPAPPEGAEPPPAWLILIRHGDYRQRAGAPSARQPFPLTETGRAQAAACADAVAEMIAAHDLPAPSALHSSLQLRAWQTADILRRALDLPPIAQTAALAERGLGAAANLTVEEIEAVLREDPRHPAPPPGWKSDAEYRLPLDGAESLSEAGARVAAHLRAAARPGTLSIHVGHGASFRHACAHLGVLRREDVPKLSMFHARPSLIRHQAHGIWAHSAGDWKIRPPREAALD